MFLIKKNVKCISKVCMQKADCLIAELISIKLIGANENFPLILTILFANVFNTFSSTYNTFGMFFLQYFLQYNEYCCPIKYYTFSVYI